MSKVPKGKDMTPMQERYHANLAKVGFDGRRKVQCAGKAGYKYPYQSVRDIDKSSRLNTLFKRSMGKDGTTIPAITGEMHRLIFESNNPFAPNQPDNEVRRKTLDMAIKIWDGYPAQKIDIEKKVAHVTLTADEIRQIEKDTGETLIDAEIIEDESEDADIEPL